MIKYETFLVSGGGKVSENLNYNIGDLYLHGIVINYYFSIGQDGKKLFVVNTEATQKNMLNDTIIYSTICESVFLLTGTRQDFINEPFSFFETLMLLSVAHTRGVFSFTVWHENYGFSILPDHDCKNQETILTELKNKFIEQYIHE